MADETQISTPAENADVMTSSNEVSDVGTTSEGEITGNNQAAEIETKEQNTQEEKLYAGKYKTVEELEKGYAEQQKAVTQSLQMKAKFEEMLKKQERQEALRLEKAQAQGFNSADEMQIARQVAQAELNEFFATAPYYVADDVRSQVQQYLNAYQLTGDIRYLDEAKRYYPADFIEKVAIGKKDMETRLKSQFEQQSRDKANKAMEELANMLKSDYAEFLSDLKENKGKAQALEMFCEGNFIQSKEDMDVFVNIYNQIADVVKAGAIKEYEAQKAIEKTKQAAQIEGNPDAFTLGDNVPSYAQLASMSQEDFEKACDKFGIEKIMAAK